MLLWAPVLAPVPSATGNVIDVMWCQYQWYHITKKVMLHLNLIVLTWEMQWCHWRDHWHHFMPMLAAVVSDDHKRHVAPHFNHFDPKNVFVLMMIPYTLCNAGAKAILWPESCYTSFQLFWPKKYSGAIDNVIGVMWCQCQWQWHYMIRRVVLHFTSVGLT